MVYESLWNVVGLRAPLEGIVMILLRFKVSRIQSNTLLGGEESFTPVPFLC